MSITTDISRFAASLRFEDLSADAVYQAKRFLLDSLGCALGGYGVHDVTIALQVLDEIAGRGPCTVIGSGKRVDPVSASLANALMIRCMDYNDIYWKQDPSHPSDIFPAALACCEYGAPATPGSGGAGRERAQSDGRELIAGLVLGHEFECRFCEAAVPGIRERGWHHATLTAFVSPIVAGRMLHLPADQIQHAIGISASRHATLGAVTAGKLTMMKNTVDPMATQSGVLAALLAGKGYTGPEHVVEGKEGLTQCLGPEWKLEALTDGLAELSAGGMNSAATQAWRITQCGMKFFPTEALTHAPISAVLDLVREHDLKPEQVEKVHIRSLARAGDILSDPSKYDPHTKETADHSLPYVIAAALVDRQVTPAQFTPQKIMDPVIRAQLRKVEVVGDPEIEKVFPAVQRVIVTIRTTSGQEFTRQLDYPKGDPRNPLSDAEIEEKFAALAGPVLSRAAQKKVRETVWNMEKLEKVSDLMKLMKARKARGPVVQHATSA
jgi:2-methylcitrate dehydratase